MTNQVTNHELTTLGQRLRRAREVRGLKQHELAAKVGSQPFEISRWEKDRHVPQAEKLEALALALGVSRPWLVFGDDVVVVAA